MLPSKFVERLNVADASRGDGKINAGNVRREVGNFGDGRRDAQGDVPRGRRFAQEADHASDPLAGGQRRFVNGDVGLDTPFHMLYQDKRRVPQVLDGGGGCDRLAGVDHREATAVDGVDEVDNVGARGNSVWKV